MAATPRPADVAISPKKSVTVLAEYCFENLTGICRGWVSNLSDAA